ncbi:MAG: beta-galactosidase [Paenibacillaceae bacterium]|jgi:hypothetical protein|nr:beta-galactosidase [Paenibacillaceae bacterium]
MRFRQVHLDFHTSEAIAGIGESFSKRQFQAMLKLGHVDSITVFSKCHHGWAYHPSDANEQHPHLSFDLLGAMIEAAHEIGVKTPVYLSAGLDEKLARRHPQWLRRDQEDRAGLGFMSPGYHDFCLNTPYLEVLLAQIREAAARYDADGIFLDIVGVRKCYCQFCVAQLLQEGKDPRDEQAVLEQAERTYMTYAARVREAIDSVKPGLSVYHNGGHQWRGRRDLAAVNTHLELESLPTYKWGYDHFPLSARYAQTLGMDYLGMTGKFHYAWGEFGGYKHPDALRYETSLSLALGAGCSIGDQLHPGGEMDEATYALIGAAYAEVEEKEPWCRGTFSVADIGLLSAEAAREQRPGPRRQGERDNLPDAGASRMLTEGNYLFDVIDVSADFAAYKVLVLPDELVLWPELAGRLQDYLRQGGKVLASGRSGLMESQDEFALDLGAVWEGSNPYCPDYFHPSFVPGPLRPAPFVMYAAGQRISRQDGAISWGERENPYFNRDLFTFCSHRHTPSSRQTGGPGMVEGSGGIYIAWEVFRDYAEQGHLILKEMVLHALRRLLPQPAVTTDLPAQGTVVYRHQPGENRHVLHLLCATPVRKGRVEVIEDVLPLHNIWVSVKLSCPVERIYLAPQGKELPFATEGDRVKFTVPYLHIHQMVVLEGPK